MYNWGCYRVWYACSISPLSLTRARATYRRKHCCSPLLAFLQARIGATLCFLSSYYYSHGAARRGGTLVRIIPWSLVILNTPLLFLIVSDRLFRCLQRECRMRIFRAIMFGLRIYPKIIKYASGVSFKKSHDFRIRARVSASD